jgi:hypothetical protein
MKPRLTIAKKAGRALLIASLALTTLVTSAGEPSRALPHLSLADPRGVLHRIDELTASGPVILVVSAPTASTEGDQRGWDEVLAATRPSRTSAQIVFVEDLSQSWFPTIARDAMREAFDPTRGPLVLIDEDGRARRALRVDEDATVVLVYDARGRLAAAHPEAPTRLDAQHVWEQARSTAD